MAVRGIGPFANERRSERRETRGSRAGATQPPFVSQSLDPKRVNAGGNALRRAAAQPTKIPEP